MWGGGDSLIDNIHRSDNRASRLHAIEHTQLGVGGNNERAGGWGLRSVDKAAN